MMSKKSIVAALIAVGIVMLSVWPAKSSDRAYEYQQWKAQYSQIYTEEEDLYRREIFYKTLEKVNKHNSQLGASYKMGLNQFTAMPDEEFA
jgi:hypothetical protein